MPEDRSAKPDPWGMGYAPRVSHAIESLRQGRYAVVRVLGEGAQATTYEAVDKKVGRPVAIKRFVVRGAKSWKEVELAEREARVLASLSHPSIPKHIEHFEENGELFLVTEKVEGESLAERRRRGARLGEADVWRFLADADAALSYLHGRAPAVIHRDIKPSNVILRPDGSFSLIDFGSVTESLGPEGGSTVVGTFGYMAPEQFQGRASTQSDVYAVGATALAMLTGKDPDKLPHRGLAIDVQAALSGTRTSPALASAIAAMLEPDPDRRAKAVGPLLRKRPHEVPGNEPPSRSERKAQRRWEKQERRRAREARRLDVLEHPERYRDVRDPLLLGPFLWIALVGLSLAQLVVMLALRVFVPTLLGILSVIFGKGLVTAARAVVEAGRRADAALDRAKGFLQGRNRDIGVRFVDPKLGQRIDVPSQEAPNQSTIDAEFEAEIEALDAEEAARHEERRRGKR